MQLYIKNTILLILTIACINGCAVMDIVSGERSTGHIVDDSAIKTKLIHEYVQKDINELFHPISITVNEGRVLLAGKVSNQEYMEQAVKIAWSIRGVKEVINELRIKNKDKPDLQDVKNSTGDSWIKTQIKTKLLFHKEVRSINYTIDVQEGVVYILGIAQNKQELDNVIEAVKSIKGVKKVISHAVLRKDPRRAVQN